MMTDPSPQILRPQRDPFRSYRDLLAGPGFQRLAGLQAQLKRQLRLLRRAAFASDDNAKGNLLRRRTRDLQVAEERVEGKRKPVVLLAHLKPAADRHVKSLPLNALGKGGEFGLALGVGASHDQAQLLMKDTQAPLTVEIKLAGDGLRADQA